MNTLNRTFVGVLALAMLGGCAGRDAAPVTVAQTGDQSLSCQQIAAEQQNNATRINALIEEDENAHNSNIAIGVVGALLFWPALFAIDATDAQEVEIQALKDRTNHLNNLALQKHCNDPAYQQPVNTFAPLDGTGAALQPTTSTKCFWNDATKKNVCATN
jgi:hypothetical protein